MFLNTLARSIMPVITCFTFHCYEEFPSIALLELIESKITLKSMVIDNQDDPDIEVPPAFILGLVELLKRNIGHRPCFSLNIIPEYRLKNTFNTEVVSKV